MSVKLSIIIPCYNCEKTVEQSFNSCFRQKINYDFEIILVDDCSTDNTRDLIEKFSLENSNVKIGYHNKNKGGGATRNTAIKMSSGNIFFCLDSDDILPEGTLGKMLDYIIEKNIDGVGIHKSIKFIGNNPDKIDHVNTFGYINEEIPFNSLIEKKDGPFCSLYSTFMFTKKAFDMCEGYTERHGFDTQDFAWKFLSNGLVAHTCENTEYLHRVNFNKSYYIREYENGKVNYNWFKIFEDFFYLFSSAAQHEILSFDFKNPNINIMENIKYLKDIFKSNYHEYITNNAQTILFKDLSSQNLKDINHFDLYWLAEKYLNKNNFGEALRILKYLEKEDFIYPACCEKKIICERCLDGEKFEEVLYSIEKNRTYLLFGSKANIITRIIRKIKKILKANNQIFISLLVILSIKNNLFNLMRINDRRKYYNKIENIKRKKEITLDIEFGGLGDFLSFTSLPRLLKEKYDINFYLTEKSIRKLRTIDTFKITFELNPYFKGIKKNEDYFKYSIFSADKNFLNFFFDKNGESVTETLEKQFKLSDIGKGLPEIFYKPNKISDFSNVILVDKNYISGKKLGWIYNDSTFEKEIAKHQNTETKIIYIDTQKQDIFKYADMIYSCKHFITVLSGGAALAACFDKDFTVILPENVTGGSVDQFVFKNSKGNYIK